MNFQAQNLTFNDFDNDGDNLVEKQEFMDTFTSNYAEDWDNTDNTNLDDEDFYTATYSVVDIDEDDLIDEDEWNWGYNYYYGDYLGDDFDLYDYDDYISYEEYYDAFDYTDYYATWDVDRDTYLSESELAEGVFESWDVNDNGVIDKNEFNSFDAYYLDI